MHALPGVRTRDRVITFEEEQTYLAFSGPNLRALTILAVDTGMRPKSELFRLEWPQVQLEASEMMPNGYIKVREGKTQSAERILPLTARARETLLILRMEPRRKPVGIPWTREFRAHCQHPEITSQGNSESRPKTLPVLLLAPHLRYEVR